MDNNSTVSAGVLPDRNSDVDAKPPVLADGDITQPVERGPCCSVTDWLNAFAAKECDQTVMLRGVAEILRVNLDAGWELLSLIDQYYRRRKLSADEFHALHAKVQALIFGNPPAAPPHEVMAAATHPPRATEEIARPPAPRAIAVGDLLRNRYRIQRVLGRGGMGIVYAAIDQFRVNEADSGQRVAIKVLNTDSARRPQLLDELRGEFQRLQSLSHPNIVRAHDFDRDGDLTFFTMEYLSGASLSRVLENRHSAPLHRSHALSIIQQVGAAVTYAHSRGVVHGDLNPRNLFITDDGELRVLDFGASHRLSLEPKISEFDDPTRVAVATPSYASCEMLVGKLPDTRDDLYSLACIAYVILQGRHPFQGNNALVARTKRLTVKRPARLSARQWHALKSGLQLDRKLRPNDVAAWLAELGLPKKPVALPPLRALTHGAPPREQRGPWLLAAAIAAGVGIFWWTQTSGDLIAQAAAAVANTMSTLDKQFGHDTDVRSIANARQPTVSAATPPTPPTEVADVPHSAPSDAPAVPAPARSGKARPHARTPVMARTAAAAVTSGSTPALARIELAADSVDTLPLQAVASVVVRRRSNYRHGVSFSWWTESGTAKAGRDFMPVKARTDYIPAGDNQTRLLVPIVADPRRNLAKSFYVVVGNPSEDATLGTRTVTMVTIPATR